MTETQSKDWSAAEIVFSAKCASSLCTLDTEGFNLSWFNHDPTEQSVQKRPRSSSNRAMVSDFESTSTI